MSRVSPVGQGVFDVVGCGINEHMIVVPSGALESSVFRNGAETLKLAITDSHGCTEGNTATSTHTHPLPTPSLSLFLLQFIFQ